MTPRKLIADVAERSFAMRIAAALQDLIEPPPEALTVFEHRLADGAPSRWRVEAYFSEATEAQALTAEVAGLLGEEVPAFVAEEVPDLNWVALSQAALPPVRAHRFTVHGSHDRERVPQGPNALLIDAGEAFGTAHHATTYGCLVALGRISGQSFSRILDLGCGSGVLAIAAARLWPQARIAGVDIDRQSVIVAKENAKANRANAIHFVAGAGVSEPSIRARAPYDLIIANILAGPLIGLAGDLRRALRQGGVVVLSGILNREAASVIAAYRAQGFALATHQRYEGWSALELRKRSA